MTKERDKLPKLEESMNEISKLIEKMEHGELSLEESLHHFERGVILVKHCQKILVEAEQKVQILIQNHNQEELRPYSDTNDKGEGHLTNEDNNT
jgi:exodeoxyribonuclease VII small subunit